MEKVTVYASAKVNLSLNVTGVRGEMHTLDMVMASVDLADRIVVCPRDDTRVTVAYSDPRIAVGGDSVTKAVNRLKELSGKKFGADITVEKNIPLMGGLGGSGADAAGVIAALSKIFGFGEKLCRDTAQGVGSDILYLLKGGFARVTGTGDEVAHFEPGVCYDLVLAMGETGVLSKNAYGKFDELYPDKRFIPADNDSLIGHLKAGETEKAYPFMENALTAPAIALNSEIVRTLSALKDAGAGKVLMSGSGAVCLGFFKNGALAGQAAADIQKQGLWAKAVQTVKKGIDVQ